MFQVANQTPPCSSPPPPPRRLTPPRSSACAHFACTRCVHTLLAHVARKRCSHTLLAHVARKRCSHKLLAHAPGAPGEAYRPARAQAYDAVLRRHPADVYGRFAAGGNRCPARPREPCPPPPLPPPRALRQQSMDGASKWNKRAGDGASSTRPGSGRWAGANGT